MKYGIDIPDDAVQYFEEGEAFVLDAEKSNQIDAQHKKETGLIRLGLAVFCVAWLILCAIYPNILSFLDVAK